jgi:hypothetical protein
MAQRAGSRRRRLARTGGSLWRRTSTASTCCASRRSESSDEGHTNKRSQTCWSSSPRCSATSVASSWRASTRACSPRRRGHPPLRTGQPLAVQKGRAARAALPGEATAGKLVRVVAVRCSTLRWISARGPTPSDAWVGVELSESNQKQLWVPPGLPGSRTGSLERCSRRWAWTGHSRDSLRGLSLQDNELLRWTGVARAMPGSGGPPGCRPRHDPQVGVTVKSGVQLWDGLASKAA